MQCRESGPKENNPQLLVVNHRSNHSTYAGQLVLICSQPSANYHLRYALMGEPKSQRVYPCNHQRTTASRERLKRAHTHSLTHSFCCTRQGRGWDVDRDQVSNVALPPMGQSILGLISRGGCMHARPGWCLSLCFKKDIHTFLSLRVMCRFCL